MNVAGSSAQEDFAIYGMVHHFGMRLTAEAPIADGWESRSPGCAGQKSISTSCHCRRSLVRAAACGCASVRQRRTGMDQVPEDLRAIGVTVREHEVLQLLVERLTNKAIANRLHISPRTVEKHVASLIIKAEVADRIELSDFAASTYSDGG